MWLDDEQITELKGVGDAIIEFMRARAVQLDGYDWADACNVLLASFINLEKVNQQQERALKKIAANAQDGLDQS